MAFSQGIQLKKRYGQHFLRDQKIVDHMLEAVELDDQSSVFEIGCGDGFLTQSILKYPLARLWVFEIDEEWASYVKNLLHDQRLTIYTDDILDVDFSRFEPDKPWTLLSNLPYQITFPILFKLKEHASLLKEGVIMIQEEVAQKLLKQSGRGYGFNSLFFQHYFELKKLDKIPPTAFYPPPKIFSRLIYFKPRKEIIPIPDETGFWQFIKIAFRQPRRTLRNNLAQTHFDIRKLSEDILGLRAGEMTKEELLRLWDVLRESN